MAQLALFLFGSPRLALGEESVEISRRKALALLVYLAMSDRPHRRDALAALLWPEYDQSRARGALRRTLSALNTALPGDWLAAGRETIELKRQAGLWVDVVRFRHLLAEARAHEHTESVLCPVCLPRLAEAVELYQADFLAGFSLRDSPDFDEWQFFQAENLRLELAGVLERLVDWQAGQGEYNPAIGYARRWLALDPLQEPAHRRLMELYAYTGQRPAALRQYQECARILAEELGAEPAPETSALHERIRAGDMSQGGEAPERSAGRPAEASHAPSAPPAPPVDPPFLAGAADPPEPAIPFVARQTELARLGRHLQAALAGQGQLVFITGEAGSGKTALVSEFARQAQTQSPELAVAIGTCNAHTGLGDPYLPFREILAWLTGDLEARWASGLISRENARRLWALFPLTGRTLAEVGPDLVGTLLSPLTLRTLAAGLEPARREWLGRLERRAGDEAGEVGQSDLFEQFSQLLRTVAQKKPLLLVIDDAQWADLASINLLFHFGRQLQTARILMIVTYRPDEVALGRPGTASDRQERHPLEPVINELKRTYGQVQVDLGQTLDLDFVNALLDTQPNRFDEAFRLALFQQTHGHPLFTVELLRAMQERGAVVQDDQGRWQAGAALNWADLPARVEAVIEERLGRLDRELRELLAVASVEGEQFTAQVIARVQALGERHLWRTLSQTLTRRHHLIREQGEVQVDGHFLARYEFSHTLFQQYLYQSLSPGERRLLHRQVAMALEELYASQLEQVTVQLARHYAEAGQAEKAIDYLLQAGDKARALYAHQEALDFYRQALTLLKQQGAYERAARTLMKMGLTHHLAFNFEQARRAYGEGFALWQQAGSSRPVDLPPAPHPLRVVGTEPVTLDPIMAGEGISARIIDQLFAGLVEQSPEMEIIPNLARSWELLEDGRRYLFHLRSDIRWSDGTPVTAGDFAYAWKRALEPARDSPIASLLYDIKGARAFHQGELADPDRIGVQALDDRTLAVELEGPTGYFLHLLAHNAAYPLPRSVVQQHGPAWTDPDKIVTNGPFKLARWLPGRAMTLERNPDYQGRRAGNVTGVELTFMEDRTGELALYRADQADISALWFLSGPEIDRVRQRYADDYLAGPALNTHYVGFKIGRPPFNDRRVRRAFVMAVDKETLAHVVLGGYAFPATGGFIPPGMPGHSPGIGLPYDPDRARRLLAEAGYPAGRRFPALEWLSMPGTEPVMAYLEAQWAENLGVTLTGRSVAGSSYFDKLRQFPAPMFRVGWKADYPDPDNFLRANFFRQETGWSHQQYEQLVEEARRVTDQAARMELYRRADRILMEEAVIMPFLYLQRHQLVKPWVSRYPTSPLRSAYWKDVVIEPH